MQKTTSNPKNPLYTDKNWLTMQYWGFELSQAKIAELVEKGNSTIRYWMKKYKIPQRKPPKCAFSTDGYKIIPPSIYKLYPLLNDKNWLIEQHWGYNLSLIEIAKKISSTLTSNKIKQVMEKNNIPIYSDGNLKSELQTIGFYHYPDWLVEQHYDNQLSIEKIAKDADVSGDTISSLMHEYGFPVNHQIEHTERNEEGKRWCSCCEKWLDEKEFQKNKKTTDGLHPYCKECRKFLSLERREIERIIALQIYSNRHMKCEICGNENIDILTIDHVDGGGYKHRKDNSIKGQFVRWLKRNNYPKGYRVLCWNCNHKERLNNIEWEWNSDWDYRMDKRISILQIYSQGTMNCAICDEDNIDCLAIDHINGGGKQHRIKINTLIENWLERNNYPGGFRILCHNCNHLEKLRLQVK